MPPIITNIHSLLPRIYTLSKLILFVDGSSSIMSSEKLDYFCAVSNTVPSHIKKLFAAYKLDMNQGKTVIIQIRMSFSLPYPFVMGENKKCKIESENKNSLPYKLITT